MNVHTIQLADCVGTRSSASRVYAACVVVTVPDLENVRARRAAWHAEAPARLEAAKVELVRAYEETGWTRESFDAHLDATRGGDPNWTSEGNRRINRVYAARIAVANAQATVAAGPTYVSAQYVRSWHSTATLAHKAAAGIVGAMVRTDIVVRQTVKRGTTACVTAALSEED
jgi:hypothetical protein